MKKIALLVYIVLFTSNMHCQTSFNDYKVGSPFTISLPDYMSKTIGLNDAAIVQYKSSVKDVYGFVIVDNKEELKLAELNYSSINDFFDYFIKDFGATEKNRVVSKPIVTKKGTTNILEADVTMVEAESNVEIYYLIGIVETKNTFYKVFSWSAAAAKDQFKEDFRKIIYSIKE